MYSTLTLLLSCIFFTANLRTEEVQLIPNKQCASCNLNNCCGQSNLNLCTLCSDKVIASCIESDTIAANSICTSRLVTEQVCTSSLFLNKLCANEAVVDHECSNSITTTNLCAAAAAITALCSDSITTNSICVSGNLKQCAYFIGRAALSTSITYTLGDPIPFDQINLDPSNSFAFNPFRWITPEGGSYILTVQVLAESLNGPSLITGSPVALLEVWVDGLLRRQEYSPFLAFNDGQATLTTSLMNLEAGEEVIARYKILVMDSTLGLVEYPGTVTLVGSPGINFRSFFYIHYLSSNCPPACPPCNVQCTPCSMQGCSTCNVTPCVSCCQPVTGLGLRD